MKNRIYLFLLGLLMTTIVFSAGCGGNSAVTSSDVRQIAWDTSSVENDDLSNTDESGSSSEAEVTDEEIAAESDAEQMSAPISSVDCEGLILDEVVALFEEAGFTNIVSTSYELQTSDTNRKDYEVVIVMSDSNPFEKGDEMASDSEIQIAYIMLTETEKDDIVTPAETDSTGEEVTRDNSEKSQNEVIVPDSDDKGDNLVWVPTNGGTKYHSKENCSQMVDPRHITEEHAIRNGYEPCGICFKHKK